MNEHGHNLLIAAGVGWFLLTYVLALGKKGPLRTLIWTIFYWTILVDAIALMVSSIEPLVKRDVLGMRFVGCFVILPYVLSGLRIYWLRRSKRIHVVLSDPPHAPEA